MELKVQLTKTKTLIQLPKDGGTLSFTKAQPQVPAGAVLLAIKAGRLVEGETEKVDEYLVLTLPWGVEPETVTAWAQAVSAGEAAPKAQEPAAKQFLAALALILPRFGVALTPAPAKKGPAKARHRFNKALAQRPFTAVRHGSKATVYWRKPKEMVIERGAVLADKLLLNQDGSKSYGTKYGEKLRADNADAISGFKTTADVTLRSVNEVGLFLYFGDTNGWLVLQDQEGNTLDALTRA